MCLRLLYLITTRLLASLRLTRSEDSWKSADILLLRHQLTVLQRQVHARPRTSWADRALIAVLLNVIPRPRRAALPMFITPDTVLRWHRDIVRRRWPANHSTRGRAARALAAASGAGFFGWPARTLAGATGRSTVSSPASASR